MLSKNLDKKTEDIVGFARDIEKLIDESSFEIFRDYKADLLKENNVYLVPAVWGAAKDGELTDTQQEIYASVSPVIKEVLDLLDQEYLSSPRRFALGYIVRGLFVSKIIYMVEFYKNRSGKN
jgi:hypothetical protein